MTSRKTTLLILSIAFIFIIMHSIDIQLNNNSNPQINIPQDAQCIIIVNPKNKRLIGEYYILIQSVNIRLTEKIMLYLESL